MGRFSELRKKAKKKTEKTEDKKKQSAASEEKEIAKEPATEEETEKVTSKLVVGKDSKGNIRLPSSGLADEILSAMQSGKEILIKEEEESEYEQILFEKIKKEEALIQLVVFSLEEEKYGIDIFSVMEILNPLEVVRVPASQKSLMGVINLRGNVLPVFDFRVMFGMNKKTSIKKDTRFIVVESEKRAISFVVDKVFFVSKVTVDGLESVPPQLQLSIGSEFITGIAKINGDVVAIIDIEKLIKSPKLKGG